MAVSETIDGSVSVFGVWPRRALVGLFVGFVLIATALVILDSTVARAATAIVGLAALAAVGWFILGQFAAMFDLLTRVGEDGLGAQVEPEDMPRFAPLAAAVMSRGERSQEHRNVLADLRATSERLALTLEVATQGLFEIHFEPGNAELGRGRYFVSGMEFFGLPVHELVEQDIDDLNSRVRPEHREAWQRTALSLSHLDEVYGVDVQVQNLDGEWRWLAFRGRTLERVDGDPVRILAVLNDITHRKELEHRAAHTDTMRSLGHLVSGLTHDLNNVLAVVRANAELFLDFDVSPEDAERLALRTREMADDGFALLRGLLRLTPSVDEASVVDVNRLVSLIADSLSELAPPHVSIDMHAHDEETLVRGDRARLDQVVLNLGLNALDAVGATGRVALTTRTSTLGSMNPNGLPPGDYVIVDVTDDGQGIDRAVEDTLFEPFVTTKPPGMGTGLGLATSFDTVSQVGGAMYAANNVDSPGATITVVLPLVQAQDGDSVDARPSAVSS